jgi:hypothetical protein
VLELRVRWTSAVGLSGKLFEQGILFMSNHALCIKITAQPGQREELIEHILDGARAAESFEGCHQFAVNASITQPDVVWMYEIFARVTSARR